MAQPMVQINVEMKEDAEIAVISLKSDIDADGGGVFSLKETIDNLIGKKHCFIIIDMSEVGRICSRAFEVMLIGLARCRKEKGDLRIAAANDEIRRYAREVRLDAIIKFFDTVDEAVKSFH